MIKHSVIPTVAGEEVTRIPPDQLLFDPENPRLVDYMGIAPLSQEELIRVLWQQMAVDELALSIAENGYFDYEPLFVVKEHGKWFVIEGNRRLAAVKLLLDEELRAELRATDLPKISQPVRKSLAKLPVIITDRKSAWQYLGFKHINGPQKWDSYAKAQYVAEVHDGFGVPLTDIARQIGDKHQTVQRLYRALKVVEQAEREKVFLRSNRYKKHFSFSHLYTGLEYEGIATFVGLKDEAAESQSPIKKGHLPQLGEFCRWLFGDKTLDQPPVVETQNPHLRQLNEVLSSEKATASLRANLPLTVALEVSYGDERVFQNSLINSKEQLQKARGTLSTGFHGEEELMRLANVVADLAGDLVDEMERKTTPRRRRRSDSKE